MNNKANYKYAIAFGSNLGDRKSHIEASIELIESELGKILKRSKIYESSPIGAADQAFLNGGILVESSLSPDLAMEKLLQIEIRGGRKRDVKWGNRTIDLDIILVQHNDCPMLIDSELITAPHPEAHKRDFVIVPLAEICPEWSIFPTEETISELATKKFFKHDMKKT